MTPIDDESILVQVLEDLTTTLRQGGTPDIDQAARDHPRLAADIRELWAAVAIAEALASPPFDLDETSPWPRPYHDPLGVDEESHQNMMTFGRHELLEELGRGGMGVVYRARQVKLGRIVALKRLLRADAATTADLARFHAEAVSAARLDHPHIVPVYSVDAHEGQPYFVMKYIEGTTLARRLADGPLPPVEAAALLAPVSRAIHYAHQRGVLHRDLKPSNILIDRDGCPFVGDFGLAKQIDVETSLTRTGAILGTPSYMAPEQASGGRGVVGPASDVYSLGAVLYQMLTGRPPFQAASALDTILLVLEQDPIPPRVFNPRADPDLEMIALKCLQKQPELRYPDAEALADDLDAYLAGQPISARSTTLRALATRLMTETHHAAILENWGLLWIYHSLAMVAFFGFTNILYWEGVKARWPYVAIFTLGLGTWAAIFWALRRRGGPISFIERQLAHVWGSGVVAINLIFLVEWLLDLPVLTLAPMLAVTNGMLFMVKAGILSGIFYVYAAALFLTLVPMALIPGVAPLLFGLVSASCFFTTGLKYHLRRLRTLGNDRSLKGR